MNDVIAHCRSGWNNNEWYVERLTLLYEKLLDAEHSASVACRRIDAAKTRYAKRTRTAHKSRTAVYAAILWRYRDRYFCDRKSRMPFPYHLIRVFKAVARLTPMQYLTAVRMDSALRLCEKQN